MEYAEAVLEFRQLDERIEVDRWRQAEIIWQQIEARNTVAGIAFSVGKSPRHITTLYKVWDLGPEKRATLTFEAAYALVKDPNRLEGESTYQSDARTAMRNLPAEKKAEVVKEWLADDTGGHVRSAIARVTHQHDTDTERHITSVREARTNDGERPDFERVESVQRVINAYNELVVAASKLPGTLSDHSKSMIAFVAARALPTVQYHADLEHEHGFDEDELAKFFEARP